LLESTRKLIGNLFDVEDLGARDLKGIGAPVRAWAALRPASVESRFVALHASGLTELVGREEEVELLLRWMLGYPEAALADAEHALKRMLGRSVTLLL
jgi:hypothetical protein